MLQDNLDAEDQEKMYQKLVGNEARRKSVNFQSLPPWLQDNDYLYNSHRPPMYSFTDCLMSIFEIHTETVNIWSHLLACLLFIVLGIAFLIKARTLQEILVFGPFFIGATLCFGMSTSFHTFYCHSFPVGILFSQLDYCGISLLILGSIIPWVFYSFCSCFWLQTFYLSFEIMLGICATLITILERFNAPKYRPLRAAVFIVFGLSSVIPIVHSIAINGWYIFFEFGAPLLTTAFLYILGAVLYATQVPERFFPGKCDVLFHSHQIFHMLVVLATIVDYLGLMRLLAQSQTF